MTVPLLGTWLRRIAGLLPPTAAALLVAGCAATPAVAPSREAALQDVLESFRAEHDVPGIGAAIVLDDGRIVAAAAGLADRERGLPMTPETPMLAASVGKTLVAATVLSLDAAGRLDVDAPLSDYLGTEPWFDALPNARRITLRHLLTHTAGLPDHVNDAAFGAAFAARAAADTPPFTGAALVGFILDDAPLFEPGGGWAYTDTGYVLLGLVVESVTGRPWSDAVEARFLRPLGLVNTRPSDTPSLPGLAAGYVARDNAFGLPVKSIDDRGRMVWNPAVEHAGGGFVSTPVDLARWGDALFRGAAVSPAVRARLLDGVPTRQGDATHRYGAGVGIETGGPFGAVYGHAGWIPGYVSSLRHYPQLGVTIAFQVNTDVGLADGAGNPLPALERRLARLAREWR